MTEVSLLRCVVFTFTKDYPSRKGVASYSPSDSGQHSSPCFRYVGSLRVRHWELRVTFTRVTCPNYVSSLFYAAPCVSLSCHMYFRRVLRKIFHTSLVSCSQSSLPGFQFLVKRPFVWLQSVSGSVESYQPPPPGFVQM